MALIKTNARSASALDATILTGNLPSISGASLTGVSSKIIGMEKVYYSDTLVSFSSESGTNLTGNTYYPNSGKISGSYTKQESSSHILMLYKYSLGHSSSNFHGTISWVTGKEAYYKNHGNDARQFGWYHDESSVGAFTASGSIFWNGGSSNEVQGTGSKTFNFCGAVSGTRSHTHKLNFNPSSSGSQGGSHSDTPNLNCYSEIIIIEYEA